MNKNTVDVYVLVKNETAHADIEPVVKNIGTTKGVRRVNINEYIPSLMAVKYDPAYIDSQAILASLRQQGYHASLVGM